MDLVTLLLLKLTANLVGRDEHGNRYYEERKARTGKPPRRYVRYNGIAEASKVPADWHGWLHHTEPSPPPEGGYDTHDWQREHKPNVTGTANAYRPQGHMLRGGKRKSASGKKRCVTKCTPHQKRNRAKNPHGGRCISRKGTGKKKTAKKKATKKKAKKKTTKKKA